MRIAVALSSIPLMFASMCNRPSPEACEESLTNVRRIVQQDPNARVAPSDVEKCTSDSTKEAVACNTAARTVEDLSDCLTAEAKARAAG